MLGALRRVGRARAEGLQPADHFLDIISVDYRTPKLAKSAMKRIEKLAKGVAREEVPIIKLVDNVPAGKGDAKGLVMGFTSSGRAEAEQNSKDASRFWIPFKLLLARTWRGRRGHGDAHHQVHHADVLFAAFGVVYLRMARDQTSIQDRTGILFFQAMNQAFGSAIGISKIIPQQLKVVSRERGEDVHAAALLRFHLFGHAAVGTHTRRRVRHGHLLHDRPARGLSHYLIFLAVMTLENFARASGSACAFRRVSRRWRWPRSSRPPSSSCFSCSAVSFIWSERRFMLIWLRESTRSGTQRKWFSWVRNEFKSGVRAICVGVRVRA